MKDQVALPVFAAFFFFSGAAGLIYEVLWMRRFGLEMGNTTVSLSAVLTAFMGGLAIGSALGGRIADRRHDHLRLYGLFEILIGLYALGVPTLIVATRPILASLYQANPGGAGTVAVRFVLATAIMIVPTILMGATLPFLIKYFTVRREAVGRRVGMIYGINTVGAMAGAFLAGFYLIPNLGMVKTNYTAAAVNVAVGLLSIFLGGPNRPHKAPQDAPSDEETALAAAPLVDVSPLGVRAALFGIAISGAAAMIYQVCWTRMFALLIGSSVYAFSLVVMANIGGLAVGSFMFGRWADRSKRPVLFFGAIQLGVAACAIAIAFFSRDYPVYVARLLLRHRDNYSAVLFNEFVFISLLLFLPTFLMGGMFPLVARICAKRLDQLGKSVGTVYAVNTVGAVIGSFSAGMLLMDAFGIRYTMLIAIGLNLFVAALAALAESKPPRLLRVAVAGLAIVGAAGMILRPPAWEMDLMTSGPFMIERHENAKSITRETLRSNKADDKTVYYKDGATCTVSVRKSEAPVPFISISVNGKTEASDMKPDMPTQLLCGHLGMLLNPEGSQALVIGLGGGVTLSGVLHHDTIRSVDLVEISPSVVEGVRKHFSPLNRGFLELDEGEGCLDDKRVETIIADGRNHVFLTDKKYDLIVSVPSNPWMAGISNLFTKEFFDQCLDKLEDDGVMCQWIHTYNMAFEDFMMVVKTFMSSMPQATLWETAAGDYLMVGSRQEIQADWDTLQAKLAQPKVSKHLATGGVTGIHPLLTDFISTKQDLAQVEGFKSAQINVDDSCKLEFSAPKAYYERELQAKADQIASLRKSPRSVFSAESLQGLDPQTLAWMDNVPLSRLTFIEAVKKSAAQDIVGSVIETKKAIDLNPYDPQPRAHLIIGCLYLARTSMVKGDFEKAAALTWEAVKNYEASEISADHMQAATAYYLCQRMAEKIGDQEMASHCAERLEQLPVKDIEKIVGPDFDGVL